MAGKPDVTSKRPSRPAVSRREREQPYTTESEEYRFERVKSPTDPVERRAHGKPEDGPAPPPGKGLRPRPTDGPKK